jgi:hypothetical protein
MRKANSPGSVFASAHEMMSVFCDPMGQGLGIPALGALIMLIMGLPVPVSSQ